MEILLIAGSPPQGGIIQGSHGVELMLQLSRHPIILWDGGH
jgi:hypothetical protein